MKDRRHITAILAGGAMLLSAGVMAALPMLRQSAHQGGAQTSPTEQKVRISANELQKLVPAQQGETRAPMKVSSLEGDSDYTVVDLTPSFGMELLYGYDMQTKEWETILSGDGDDSGYDTWSIADEFILAVNGVNNSMPRMILSMGDQTMDNKPVYAEATIGALSENTAVYLGFLGEYEDGGIGFISFSGIGLEKGQAGTVSLELKDYLPNSTYRDGSPLYVALFMSGATGNEKVLVSNMKVTRYDLNYLEALSPDDSTIPMDLDVENAKCVVEYQGSWFAINNNNAIVSILSNESDVSVPKALTYNGEEFIVDRLGDEGSDFNWSTCPNMTTLRLGDKIKYINCSFNGSKIEHLYCSKYLEDCGDLGNGSGVLMYVHLPIECASWGFSGENFEILIGDEVPGMPSKKSSSTQYRQYTDDTQTCCIGVGIYNNALCVTEINTDLESVEIPNIIQYGDSKSLYWNTRFGADDSAMFEGAPSLRSVTFGPKMATLSVYDWGNVSELHFNGPCPTNSGYVPTNMTLYVKDQSYYQDYVDNWSGYTVLPDGWEFEYLVVNVAKPGEFAQTYLELTDSDWTVGQYVKVTGSLNTLDLNNIKKLTSLIDLDMREASFDELPSSWMSNQGIRTVKLPESVTMIPKYAFQGCSSLSVIDAPGVTEVRDYAFSGCRSLKNVNFKPLVYTGNRGFQNSGLTSIELEEKGSYISSYAYYGTALESIEIPESVTTLPDGCFGYCRSLKNVGWPSKLYKIGSYAFSETALTEVVLPSTVCILGDYVFSYCDKMTRIELPATLVEIGYGCLNNCSSLTEVKCRAVIPPYAQSDFTSGMTLEKCNLYVPPMSVDTYRSTANWSNFYKMYALMEPVNYINVTYPISLNISEEDNEVLQGNPDIDLSYNTSKSTIGQLTITGDGTMSAGVINYYGNLYPRGCNSYNYVGDNYLPTLINHADKMRTDSLSVRLNFYSGYWNFITLPFDCEVKDIVPGADVYWTIRRYDSEARAAGTGDTWVNLTEEDVMEAGKGYIVMTENGKSGNYWSPLTFPSRNTLSKNNIFRSTSAIVDLEEHVSDFAHNRSWNLVGNPYPAYYDVTKLQDKEGEEFTTPLTIWRSGDGSYMAYSPVDDDLILRPFESFFIQRPVDFTEMVFVEEGRMHFQEAKEKMDNDGTYQGYGKPAVRERDVFNFNLLDAEKVNRARVVFNAEAKAEYEPGRDAAKMMTAENGASLVWVSADQDYEICERPFGDGKAMLSVKGESGKAMTLSLTGKYTAGYAVTLYDKVTGMTADLQKADYPFTMTDNDINRFEIVFKAPSVSGIDSVLGEFPADEEVVVSDLNGIVLYRGAVSEMPAGSQGILLVGNGKRTIKVKF